MYHSQLTRIARTSLRPVFLNPSLTRAYTAPAHAAPNQKAKNSNEHKKNPEFVARGLKAAIHNPNVSTEAKDHATHQLKKMVEKSESAHVLHQLGYKATLTNKKTSEEAKKNAQSILDGVENGGYKNEKRVMGGYKAALKNRNTSKEAKNQAKKVLKEHNAL